ncbi:MAG: SH3 domain-containing protein [Lachnospiraceae bacterium]|nr:SH3 domain-containing protein [Lachnospiraceae bacterium]
MKRKLMVITAAALSFGLMIPLTAVAAGDIEEKTPVPAVIYMPDVTAEMSNSSFWTDLQGNTDVLLATSDELQSLNEKILSIKDCNMNDLKNYKTSVDGKKLSESLESAARSALEYYQGKGYFMKGGEVISDEFVSEISSNCRNAAAKEEQNVKYGIITERTTLNAWPSDEGVYDDASDLDFDYKYLSGIGVNEPVIILSVSADKDWYYVICDNLNGWVKASDTAVCKNKSEWLTAWDFSDEETLVVCTDKIITEESNDTPETSKRTLYMGTRLELVDEKDIPSLVSNRSTYSNHVVYMPVRKDDGSYERKIALISEHWKVSEGFLPLTTENIVSTAFEWLGNCYGWGGMLSSEDCSGYVGAVYSCFGLNLARNTTWQMNMPVKKFTFDAVTTSDSEETIENNVKEKEAVLDKLPAGSVLFFSGHEMMYLGKVDGKYYVVSSVSSIMNEKGQRQRLRDVCVHSLDTKRANGATWLMQLKCMEVPYFDEDHELLDVEKKDGTVDMYRFYNQNSGEHFYSGDEKEKDELVTAGWIFEGTGWKAPKESGVPVYRLYNPNAGYHHFTTDLSERESLISLGWTDEGIGFYSSEEKSVPVYREYDGNSGHHNYTTEISEHEGLMSLGWKGEGIAWYGR